MRLKHDDACQAAHPVDVAESFQSLAHEICVRFLRPKFSEPRFSRPFLVVHSQSNRDRRAHVLQRLCSTRKPLRRLRYNPLLSPKHQIGPVAAFAVWTTLTLAGVLYAASLGYGGRTFAATLIAFSVYFAANILFAARGVAEFVRSRFRSNAGYLLGGAAFLAYLIYAAGTNSFALSRVAAIFALIFVPLALAMTARGAAPGAWQIGRAHV